MLAVFWPMFSFQLDFMTVFLLFIFIFFFRNAINENNIVVY